MTQHSAGKPTPDWWVKRKNTAGTMLYLDMDVNGGEHWTPHPDNARRFLTKAEALAAVAEIIRRDIAERRTFNYLPCVERIPECQR